MYSRIEEWIWNRLLHVDNTHTDTTDIHNPHTKDYICEIEPQCAMCIYYNHQFESDCFEIESNESLSSMLEYFYLYTFFSVYFFRFSMKLENSKLRIRNAIKDKVPLSLRFILSFSFAVLKSSLCGILYCVCMLFITNLSQKLHYAIANVRCRLCVVSLFFPVFFLFQSPSDSCSRSIYGALCSVRITMNNKLRRRLELHFMPGKCS